MSGSDSKAGSPSNDELVQRFPGEPITHDNAVHYRGWLRREVLLNSDDDRAAWHAPRKPVCPECWSPKVTPTEVSGNGVLFRTLPASGSGGSRRRLIYAAWSGVNGRDRRCPSSY